MAKGTKYSDVNFSVPEGADPLGIGVPDLGRSSYDPIESIRHGWEASRQERMFGKEMDQREYKSYMENLPTVEGVNAAISKKLNKEVLDLSQMFKRSQGAGPLGRFAKTREGENLQMAMSRKENEIATKIPIYNHYSGVYEKDLAVMRNPNNREKIDWELTNENVAAMNNAETVEEFAQPFANNGGSLVVNRPEEADMIGWVKSSVDTFAPGMDSEILSQGKDPNTGKWKTTTLETKDQKRIYDAIIKGYANAPRAVQNEIQRMYDVAPALTKQNEEGVIMEPDAWYASQFAPEWGTKTGVTHTTIDEDTDKEAAPGYGIPRKDDGSIDLVSMTSTIGMKTPIGKDEKTVRRTKRSGEKVYNKPTSTETLVDADYSTVSIPLVGFDKTFEMYNHASAIDTSTGKPPDEKRSSTHKAVRVDFMPVWRGPAREVEFETVTENGDVVTEKYTLNPGDRIPMNVQERLQGEDQSFSYEPYLMTSSTYGPAIEEKALAAGISWEDYVSRHGLTTIIPWDKAKRELLVKMKASKYDPTELEKIMAEVDKQLNGIDDIFN